MGRASDAGCPAPIAIDAKHEAGAPGVFGGNEPAVLPLVTLPLTGMKTSRKALADSPPAKDLPIPKWLP
jgi:hypothetical protein